jgi:hypothetical protein
MKRITLLLTVALVVVFMLAVAGPASATIHELANSECASDSSEGVANDQFPPGLTPGSQAQSEQEATPVVHVFFNPSDGASHNALRGPAPPVPGFPEEGFGDHPGTDNCADLRE